MAWKSSRALLATRRVLSQDQSDPGGELSSATVATMTDPKAFKPSRGDASKSRSQHLPLVHHHCVGSVNSMNLATLLARSIPIVQICMWTAPHVIRLRRSPYGTSMPEPGSSLDCANLAFLGWCPQTRREKASYLLPGVGGGTFVILQPVAEIADAGL